MLEFAKHSYQAKPQSSEEFPHRGGISLILLVSKVCLELRKLIAVPDVCVRLAIWMLETGPLFNGLWSSYELRKLIRYRNAVADEVSTELKSVESSHCYNNTAT
ncbi:hypothetical protein CANCADRAFT_724 [Tortispora caseinolytica NRRL Y-17796]|uniref:Uncharacterized protein n=1 Tax=Tortispora caseinolytica NRRL Y-17796 TaxID=767744 RepID=A0A1E4TK49_9ASCO|nr:hypothetical protein CANCADRAFT_724 [Tortispora caseinolytica NRRL Y-17796]